jgi:hypothetical protein
MADELKVLFPLFILHSTRSQKFCLFIALFRGKTESWEDLKSAKFRALHDRVSRGGKVFKTFSLARKKNL